MPTLVTPTIASGPTFPSARFVKHDDCIAQNGAAGRSLGRVMLWASSIDTGAMPSRLSSARLVIAFPKSDRPEARSWRPLWRQSGGRDPDARRALVSRERSSRTDVELRSRERDRSAL